MVREADRAWHAGRSSWRGERDVNSLSIGIEVVNPGHAFGYRDFTRAQVATVIALCRGIAERHGVRPEGVLAHSDVAPGRKVDPGERFPWSELAAAGVGHFVPPAPPQDGAFLAEGDRGEAVESLQSMLAVYGYGVEINGNFDRQTTQVVEAFQRHFRQSSVDGIADGSTVLTLRNLLESLPEVSVWLPPLSAAWLQHVTQCDLVALFGANIRGHSATCSVNGGPRPGVQRKTSARIREAALKRSGNT